jgi:hypothetical protein
MARPLYSINVRPEGARWRLYNYDAPAGDRLIKSRPFPFTKDNWKIHDTEREANVAAKRLQKYLDAHESRKSEEEPTQSADPIFTETIDPV